MKKVRNDSTIQAKANPLGTPTARCRHSVVANLPKNDPKVLFGKEMREVFRARPGRVMVGHDASGLEARVGGHWAYPYDGGVYAHDVLEGDWHSKNAREVYFPNQCQGLSDDDPKFKSYRSIGKGGSYCTMYGGQPPKLAETLGIPLKEAKKIYEAFWEVNKGLGLLKDHLTKVWKRDGCIYTIDGRPIYPRKEGDLINYLNQSSGAIIMKRSAIILNKYVNMYNVDAIKVIDYHDEAQADVHPSHADFYGKLAVKSIREAGKYYNMNVELDSEYIIGNNWAECH
jgi:DNA polymerase I-like protein with 3'-5' exonuclease and polymerase domains